MKSLALNLLKSLLLVLFGAVLAATSSSSSAAASLANTSSAKTLISVANRALPTTTPIPPSLQAPPHLQLRRHTLPATAATSKPHTTTTATAATIRMASASSSSRPRLLLARHAAKQIATTKATTPTSTIMTNSKRKPIITETSTLDSTRLVRHIDATTSTQSTPVSLKNGGAVGGAGVRQQRSFHSNGAQPFEDTETKLKYKTLERRQYTRSYSPTTTKPTTTATSTTGKPQHLGALRQRTASQHSLSDGSNTPRQLKQSSLPLVDDGLKTIATAASTLDAATSSNHGNKKLTILHNQQTPKT